MTLVYNEIQVQSGLDESIILFAADSRLSTKQRKYSNQRKLFRIDYLRGGVSYFGLAFVFPKREPVPLSEWLPAFIRNHSHLQSLQEFAQCLRDELSKVVPAKILSKYHSGFHLAGYTSSGYPDFVYFANIGNLQYTDLYPHYSQPSSHFLDRDAKIEGWDGVDPKSIQYRARNYRNGDRYPHAATWDLFDRMFKLLFASPNFHAPRTVKDYEWYVETKLNMLFYIYKRHAVEKVVGGKPTIFSFDTLQRPTI